MRQSWAAEARATRKVPFQESPRLAPGGRRARFDVEARLARALQENTVAARMIYLRRWGAEPRPAADGPGRRAQPGNLLTMDVEHLPLQIAIGRQGGALEAVDRAVLQPII